jgi:isocitrate dehydrogenase (NAD+)
MVNDGKGTRNTGKSVAGKNIANPIAMFNASADLLDYLELDDYALILRDAIYNALNVAKIHTPDLGGQHTTQDVVNFILNEVKEKTQI